MIIVNAILYLSSSVRYSILSFNQLFIIEILPYWFAAKNIGNYRKYDIFFNFRFTGNMIFPSIAENQENMIFTLSVFTKMLFFMQWKMVFVQFYKVIKDRHLVMGGSKHYKLLPGTSFDNCFQKLLLSSLLLYCYFCVLVVKLI